MGYFKRLATDIQEGYIEKPSDWVGKKKERLLNRRVQCVKKIQCHTSKRHYEPAKQRHVVTFKDKHNNIYIWYSSNLQDYLEGSWYQVNMTIIDHVMEDNQKVNVVNRIHLLTKQK